jgi:hypothetical protein
MKTSTLEQKVDLLLGLFQDLNEKVKDLHANQKPTQKYLTSKELGLAVGVSDKCIIKWVKAGLIPSNCYSKIPRGKYYIYRFESRLALPIAEKLRTGER